MGKNFQKNTPRKSFDNKGFKNKGPGSVTKPGNKGNNRYFSKQLENMKSPGANVVKTPNSNNKNQNQKFGSNKKSPMQNNKSPMQNKKSPNNNKSPANNKQINGKGKNNKSFQKSPVQKKPVVKDQNESEESESFTDDDDESTGAFDSSMLSKLMKNEADVDDSDFDDIDDSEDDEDDTAVPKSMLTLGKKRKLEEDEDSDSDDLDDDKLKALLEESSDEDESPPAKKSKAEVKSPNAKSPKVTNPGKGKEVPKVGAKQQQKKVLETTGKQQPKKKADKKPVQKTPVAVEPCADKIKLPSAKVTLKVADKEKILKLVKERWENHQSCTVFIRPVPNKCSYTMLKELAKEIVDARIPRKGNNGRGFAVLEFKTPQIAEQYSTKLNGKIFCGKTLAAYINSSSNSHQKFNPASVVFNQLYVSSLPKETTRADIKYIFPESNAIELPVLKDNTSKGFALITFALPETALNYFETRHNTVIRNRSIDVNFSISKDLKKKSTKLPATKATKATKQPAIKLSAIVPKKGSVKVDEVMDESDESETEEILAALKKQGLVKPGVKLSDLIAAQNDSDDESDDDSEDDIKSPPSKRKPVASK